MMVTDTAPANLARLVAIVPLRSLEGAKSRLGGTLDAEERQALVTVLLERTVRAAVAVPAITSVLVVSPDQAVLDAASAVGARPLLQVGDGLNEGLRVAAEAAAAEGATALVVLPADLPGVSAGSVASLVEAAASRIAAEPGRPVVALVPDRHGEGTNALLLSPPDVIPFAFGPDSRAAHVAAARAAGALVVEVDSALAFDLDLPEDFVRAGELGLLDRDHGG